MPPHFESCRAEWPATRSYAAAWAMRTLNPERPFANLPHQHKQTAEEAKDEQVNLHQRPSTGRTSALGRRVEKPNEARPAGPSGQRNGVTDRKHANK